MPDKGVDKELSRYPLSETSVRHKDKHTKTNQLLAQQEHYNVSTPVHIYSKIKRQVCTDIATNIVDRMQSSLDRAAKSS